MTERAWLPDPSRPPAADVLLRALELAGCTERADIRYAEHALVLALAAERAWTPDPAQEAEAFVFEVFG